ncbi:2-deoxyribose-5-phosphate aldolase [Corynebacterium sphenisci]|uniref:2-deoxyribose-5-phosphate aldolase n=1 Tax=Corynebacterium sphenisci TaxID=191493 RepID=UPI0026E00F89|nr:2-deoxyribose-5-phosphate aldolase [Corynebacterium sphenisci]MDO5730898.1 2-deoxyribose-5-phosphate aldolase [Corynebacterium sphenisci]
MNPAPPDRVDLALLDPAAPATDLAAAAARAAAAGCAGVRVPTAALGPVAAALRAAGADPAPRLGAVAGFPLGRSDLLVTAAEARLAAERGAGDVAFVADPAATAAGDASAVLAQTVALREAVVAPVQLTVVLETGLLADGAAAGEALAAVAAAAVAGGADALATGTGWHPAGVGGPAQLRILARAVAEAGAAGRVGLIAVREGGRGPVAGAPGAAELLAAGAHVVQEGPGYLVA